MDESRLENEEQFATRFVRIVREDVFQISADSLFMSHPKSVAFAAENRLRVSAKDQSTACLGEGKIKVRREASVYRSQLLAHISGNVYLCRAGRSLFSRRQFETSPKRGLPVSVSFYLSEETVFGPGGDIANPNARPRSHVIVVRSSREGYFNFELPSRRWRIRNAHVNHLPIHFQTAEVLLDEIYSRRYRASLIDSQTWRRHTYWCGRLCRLRKKSRVIRKRDVCPSKTGRYEERHCDGSFPADLCCGRDYFASRCSRADSFPISANLNLIAGGRTLHCRINIGTFQP